MIKRYPYSTRWEKAIVGVIHIYGYRAVLILFCDNQDTESESCKIEMGKSRPILTQENQKCRYGITSEKLYNMKENNSINSSYLWS